MKICILGAGSLGSAYGAALAEAGADVTLVTRNAAHVDAIRAGGLVVHEHGTQRTVKVEAAVDCSALSPVDLLVVLVKSFHTSDAMAAAAPAIGPSTTVLSLQNGLGHEALLAEFVPRAQILIGKSYVGGQIIAPGHVIKGSDGKRTIIGELDGRRTARVEAVASVFAQAGLDVVVSDDIVSVVWDKLLINVATGAITALTRLSYGPLYASPDLEALGVAAVGEAIAVAKAAGVRLGNGDARAAWAMAGAGLPWEFKPSMLQSIEKGSVTEVDVVNGAVVAAGRRLGVATPINAALLALVKGLEQSLGDASPAARAEVGTP